MQIIRHKAYSRIGLVGNPSDGYHGKTISVTIADFYAEAILYEWERLELILSQEDKSQFNSIHDLARDVQLHGYYGGIRLVKATIKRFVDYCDAQGHPLHNRNFSIRYESNIPRQVGLAGSSAIVVATLRTLMDFYSIEIPREVQASVVLSVEKNELGIGAGLQDRVAQIYNDLVYMDFARQSMRELGGYQCGIYQPLDASLLPPLYVAFKADASEPTEVFHNNLSARYQEGDLDVVSAMDQFAELARQAREALLDGRKGDLGKIMDDNFDLRKSICRLSPSHIEMVEVARQAGASAKYAGSGGAILGTYPGNACYEHLAEQLTQIGCRVFKPRLAVGGYSTS